MFDIIFDSKSKGNTPAIIFLDIKKAFDIVDHKFLIEKLKFYGADGTVILWIKNYLSDRKQATKFLGEKSIFLCIKFGVPQGSLLGPLLFSIYINDLVNACNLSHPYLFADDGALLFENICGKTYLSIRIEMMTILKWLNVNKLSLNVDKTKILIFDNANFSVKIKLSNNYAIKECKSFKYLELMIDNNLKFDIHVDYIKKKIQKRIGAMYRGCSLLPVKYRKMFANSLILPHCDYLDHWRIFWGGAGGGGGGGVCAPPQLHSCTPQHVLHPPNIYLHPPNIFAPYPRNYSIRGQAAYVPPNYSFLQLQTTPVLTFLMLSGTF